MKDICLPIACGLILAFSVTILRSEYAPVLISLNTRSSLALPPSAIEMSAINFFFVYICLSVAGGFIV